MDNYLLQRVLIVADDVPSRTLLQRILKTIGFMQIEAVASGEEALAAMQNQTIGMVLADWHISGMSGLELLKVIKNDQHLHQAKVLMVTAESRKTNILEAIRAGVDGYIMKPYSKASIQQKIDAIFSNHHSTQQSPDTPACVLSTPPERSAPMTTS